MPALLKAASSTRVHPCVSSRVQLHRCKVLSPRLAEGTTNFQVIVIGISVEISTNAVRPPCLHMTWRRRLSLHIQGPVTHGRLSLAADSVPGLQNRRGDSVRAVPTPGTARPWAQFSLTATGDPGKIYVQAFERDLQVGIKITNVDKFNGG